MNSFLKGILVGVGVGLLVAPMRGEEMRTMLRERFEEYRGYLPENEQMNQYVQQVSDRVSPAISNLGDIAQQAVGKVKDTGSSLGNLAQQATSTVKNTSQDVADTTKDAAKSAKQNVKAGATNASSTSTTTSYSDYVSPDYGTTNTK